MRRSLFVWLSLCAFACAVMMACVSTTPAKAETYGELRHFGSRSLFTITRKTHAFGVDPTDNSVYVGDIPTAGTDRIQKLSATGEVLASVSFKPTLSHFLESLEGIAVDPSLKRIYLLVSEERGPPPTIDPEKSAAAILYAFSTEAQGNKLVPASGTNAEGVLADQIVLETQSEVREHALLEPKGIAVDPTTHDVIILGDVDEGEVDEEPQLRVALQRVHSDGTLGERYVDTKQFFGEEQPNSPVVSQTGSVFVQQFDQIVQIPSDFASANPPTPIFAFETEGPLSEELLEFDTPTSEPPSSGGGLSLSPEGASEGLIYAYGRIKEDVENGQRYPGALAFKYTEHGETSEGSTVGWTGGESKKHGGGKCTIGINSITVNYPIVAAGKDHLLFMFDPSVPQVVEFGPGGEGCPTAEATDPTATVDGQPLSPSETVAPGTQVAFSSILTQANALSVEWNFGEGEKEPQIVSSDEHQNTEISHKFVRAGELTVTETIHTDDLATPTIVKQTKISVSGTAPPPTAVLEGPTEVTLGGGATERLVYLEDGGLELVDTPSHGEASFDASASFASTTQGPNRIEAYHWTFGDGHSETTSTPTVEHTYEKAGAYKVELAVTDGHGLTSEPATLTVEVKNAPESLGMRANTASAPAGTVAATIGHGISAAAGASAASNGHGSNGHGSPPAPDVVLKGTTLRVGRSGTVALELACPSGDGSCTGTVTLRTLGAIGARAAGSSHDKKKSRPTVLTLAGGRFAIAGGQTKTVVLRLTSRARALLAHTRVLRGRATIVARDPAGATHTIQATVILRA
jgi:PKD repeat protein